MTLPVAEPDPADLADESAPIAWAPEEETMPADTAGIVAFILRRFHEVHRQELPALLDLARTVESTHAAHPQAPNGLVQHLERIADALETHMQKEEHVLFPLMANGGHPMIMHPIGAMRADHDDHAQNLAVLTELTGDFRPPEDACTSWCILYDGLAKLTADLNAHIRAENEVLFPRFGA
jgi:regulator of cell morphogenesis and NO signaling